MNQKILLVLLIGLVGILSGCTTNTTESTSSTITDTTASITTSDIQVSPNCKSGSTNTQLICLIGELKKDMNSGLLAKIQLPYSVKTAKKWSNFPPAGYKDRVGPTLAELTEPQQKIVLQILKVALGNSKGEGYDEVLQILNADDWLSINSKDGNSGFGWSLYHIAFIGTPDTKGTWQLYFGGHHLAISNTYKDDILVSATPVFRGVETGSPFTINGRENMPMQEEQKAFAAVLLSLTDEQKAKAKLSETFSDLVVGPQKDGIFPTTQAGIKISELNDTQKNLIIQAIETYTKDIAQSDISNTMAKYKSELDNTYLSYSGTPEFMSNQDYVRIDGPSIWMEFSLQMSRSTDDPHPHSVWRDKTNDYGGNK